jgi:hypothetical protein
VAHAQSRPVVFDSFVDDLAGCREAPAFRAFAEALEQRYGQSPYGTNGPIEGKPGIRLALPAAIEPGIGRATATGHGETAHVTVPASGTWMGFRVRQFTFTFGQQTSIRTIGILLDAPLQRVEARFAAHFRRVTARASRNDSVESAHASEAEGGVQVTCDRSF